MTDIPNDCKYTRTHEWVRPDPASPAARLQHCGQAADHAGQAVTVGITDFAQRQLSDITYVELPEAGGHFSAGSEMAVVESIKAASDVYAPVAGTVTEINASLTDNPGIINTDPYGAGWLVRIKPDNPQELNSLISAADYLSQLPKES